MMALKGAEIDMAIFIILTDFVKFNKFYVFNQEYLFTAHHRRRYQTRIQQMINEKL